MVIVKKRRSEGCGGRRGDGQAKKLESSQITNEKEEPRS
jgi:hypothetical protein